MVRCCWPGDQPWWAAHVGTVPSIMAVWISPYSNKHPHHPLKWYFSGIEHEIWINGAAPMWPSVIHNQAIQMLSYLKRGCQLCLRCSFKSEPFDAKSSLIWRNVPAVFSSLQQPHEKHCIVLNDWLCQYPSHLWEACLCGPQCSTVQDSYLFPLNTSSVCCTRLFTSTNTISKLFMCAV